jgi:hypothetical protein
MRRGLGDLEGSPRDKRRVSGMALEIRSRVDGTKRSKRTAYEESEILRNRKASIRTPPVYHIWGLW